EFIEARSILTGANKRRFNSGKSISGEGKIPWPLRIHLLEGRALQRIEEKFHAIMEGFVPPKTRLFTTEPLGESWIRGKSYTWPYKQRKLVQAKVGEGCNITNSWKEIHTSIPVASADVINARFHFGRD